MAKTFSTRHGHAEPAPPITIREDAPEYFRSVLPTIAYEVGFKPHPLREVVCRVLRKVPDPNNWSEYPNVDGEARDHLMACPWFKVYDVVEAIYAHLADHDDPFSPETDQAAAFEKKVNQEFIEGGIGWQMRRGTITTRGEAAFESTVKEAERVLQGSGRTTAASEIGEALRDLSRRPEPDLTGAVQHALAALECTARDAVGDAKPTLGALLQRYRDKMGVPPPLDQAIEKMWGYASEVGRHLREGREPGRGEAELVVAVSAALCTYLSKS